MMEKRTNKLPKRSWAILDKPGTRIVLGLLALCLAYVFGSWAIDSGALLDYAITLLLIISGIRELNDARKLLRSR